MKKAWLTAILAVSVTGLAPSMAQSSYEEPDYEGAKRELQAWDDETVTLFFTPPIIDLAIDRLMDEMGRHYEFDEDQVYAAREVVKERFPQFILENRNDIVGIANDWVATMLGEEAPDSEDIADWAQRVRPLMDEFVGLVHDSADEMREFMTEEQQIKLDGELAAADVAVDHANRRIDHWAAGGFDPATDWHKSPEFREHERERLEQLEVEQAEASAEAVRDRLDAVGEELEQPDEPLSDEPQRDEPEAEPVETAPRTERDAWEQYVVDFIRRYQLTEAQQNSAKKILTNLQERRDNYLRRKLPAIEQLEQRLAMASTDEDRSSLREAYTKLSAPLDRYFQMLKDRLDRIPTRRQRAAAAQAERSVRAVERAAAPGQDKP